jgi:hypothetical protein
MYRTRLPVALLIAAVAAALTGCSRLPTAPAANAALARGSNPDFIGQVDDIPPPIQGQGGLVKSITLAVGESGVLTNGRFKLVIHKNSLKMPATIAMIQPDADAMQVEFEFTPPQANDFQVPVQLVADCSDDPPARVISETMYWWDGQWQEASASSLERHERTITAHAHQLKRAKLALRGKGSAQHASN